MIATQAAEPVAVWLDEADAPIRLVYRSTRFRVIDTPTQLPREHAHDDGQATGWRVTGVSASDELLVFDLKLLPSGWVAEHVFA